MDSIEHGATIGIGLEEKSSLNFSDDGFMKSFIQTYSLKINKKTVFLFKGGSDYFGKQTYNNQEWLKPLHEEKAIQIAEIMKKNNIINYTIHNGETLDCNNKWESCNPLPNYVANSFKQTLDKLLN
jgi:hypothetical protein